MTPITVIGIGKLGLCFALTLENKGYNVVGVDVNEEYIGSVNDRTLVSLEPDVENYLTRSNNLIATIDIKMGLIHSNILFLFVATPSKSNGRFDHSQIDNVVDQLIQFSIPNESKRLIIGCTTMPGYCDTVQDRLRPYGYTVFYNPEFIAQGSVMCDLVKPDILLIGEEDKLIGNEIEKIYLSIVQNQPSIHRMNRKEAEITKIALNCFITAKIAYANMVGDISRSAGCNPDIILEAIGSDSRIGNKNLRYGFGYGGPCFPRDNQAFALFAGDVNIDAVISRASDIGNRLHLKYQVEEFMKNNDSSEQVIFSGLAYKPGTNIIEESQKLALAVALARNGYCILIKDNQEVVNQIKLIYGDLFSYAHSK